MLKTSLECSKLNHASNECLLQRDCAWKEDTQECSLKMSDEMIQAMLQAMFSPDDCGWIGKMLEATTCSSQDVATCASDMCERVPVVVMKKDGKCELEKACGMNEKFIYEVMCSKGFDMQIAMAECMQTAKDQSDLFTCLGEKCENLGHLLTSTLAYDEKCKSYETSGACLASGVCEWSSGSCGQDAMNQIMSDAMPDGCSFKSLMQQTSHCGVKETKGACSAESICEWRSEDVCNLDSLRVETVTDCGVDSGAMMKSMIGTGSDDKDALVLSQVIDAGMACGELDTEEDCAGYELLDGHLISSAARLPGPQTLIWSIGWLLALFAWTPVMEP
eukprot:gnl/TRDRNA2_/TRDRNA2_76815_c0_seq1.p1 gnl/TRDRNA2_/TRDRNA2_76815_c0~~gnl/TRDRNA2_/TRDRNA2_76815_c0_seq1.p1  ORF type:complete len:333 (-),score=61.60 gnl/TRDRNA2_/TRDRNA2_76815_c0_seq1:133-1131(-)